jgi:hypothetical protein
MSCRNVIILIVLSCLGYVAPMDVSLSCIRGLSLLVTNSLSVLQNVVLLGFELCVTLTLILTLT